jgi:hypothetical protein
MVSPDSLGTACPLSGRNSTYRPVQISETTSEPPSTKEYLRSVCRNYSNMPVQNIPNETDDPKAVLKFVKACKKFGIHFKD